MQPEKEGGCLSAGCRGLVEPACFLKPRRMFLTEANVLHYLVERQFVDLETVVSGAFAVRSLTRRNRNLHVRCGARLYLVKQAKDWDLGARTTVEREAAFYRQPETRKSPLLPHCYAYDPQNSALILEYLSGHTDLFDTLDRFSPELGWLCGKAMGTFHREMESGSVAHLFPGSIPWILSHHDVTEDLEEPSGGQRELARVVKSYAEFARGLDQLRAE